MSFLSRILGFLGMDSDLHRQLVRNTVFLIGSEAVIKIIVAVLAIFIARHLGTLGYGELQFAIAFAAMFQFALDLGFNGLMVREIAADYRSARKYAENVLTLRIILALLCYAVLAMLVFFINKPLEIKWLVLLAGVQLVFITLMDFCSALFQAFDKVYLRAAMRLLYHVVLVSACLYVFLSKGGVQQFMYAYVLSACVAFLVAFFVAQAKFTRFVLGFDFGFWKKIFVEMLPFASIAILATMYNRVDMVMLSFMKGEEAVGIYAAAFNVYSAFQLMPVLAITAGYASLARLFRYGSQGFRHLVRQYFWWLLCAGVAGAVLLFLIANPLVRLVYGEVFAASGAVLQVFGICLLTGTLIYFLSTYCIISRMQKKYVRILFMALLLNICLNYVLIGKFSYLGAVVATFVAQLYQVVMLIAVSYFSGQRVWAR
ncbi:MAG: flippase [Candidatus Woesearchaeota archaeon]